MRIRSLIVATIFLAGCASQSTRPLTPPEMGAKEQTPGLNDTKSQSNRDRDTYECERESAFSSVGNKSQVFNNCMKARGYK
jgi:uncharacterized lipoprotein YajG